MEVKLTITIPMSAKRAKRQSASEREEHFLNWLQSPDPAGFLYLLNSYKDDAIRSAENGHKVTNKIVRLTI